MGVERLAPLLIALALTLSIALPVHSTALQGEPRAVVAVTDDSITFSTYLADFKIDLATGALKEFNARIVDGERIIVSDPIVAPLVLVREGDIGEAGVEWSVVEYGSEDSVARAVLESSGVDGLVYRLTIEAYSWAPGFYVKLEVENVSSEPKVMITDLGGPSIVVPYSPKEGALWRVAYSSLKAGETAYEAVEVEGEVKEPVSALKGFIAVEEVDGSADAYVGFTLQTPTPAFIYVNEAFEYAEGSEGALIALVAPVDSVAPGESKVVLEAFVSIGDYVAYNLYASNLVDEALILYPQQVDLVTRGFGFEETLKNLETRIEDLNRLVDDLRSRVDELEGKVAELEGENSYLKARIDDYRERAAEAEARLNNLVYVAPGALIIGSVAGALTAYLVNARRR
ncbi:MAG: hypothetical protein F7B17_06865 [Desulfurococcales archaeon]|nr:hypothetical protein [Desulfurococcales archaeon]